MNTGLIVFLAGSVALFGLFVAGARTIQRRALAARTKILDALAGELGGQVRDGTLQFRLGQVRARLSFDPPRAEAPGRPTRDSLPMTRLELAGAAPPEATLAVLPKGTQPGPGLSEARLPDPAFHEVFDVWADGPGTALQHLPDERRRALLALYDQGFRQDASLEIRGGRIVLRKLSWLDTEELLRRFVALGAVAAGATST